MKLLQPCGDAPIAIRAAVDQGWRAYRCSAGVLSGFTLLVGGLNLLAQLGFRQASTAMVSPAGDPLAAGLVAAAGALVIWGLSGLWLLVGLLRGCAAALDSGLDGAPVRLGLLLRPGWPAILRSGGTLALLLALLLLVRQLADASAALMTLLMPLVARFLDLQMASNVVTWTALIYLAADQLLCLPIAVLGGATPLAAVQSGRRAIDPHWLQALGLLLVVSLMLLAGVLVLLAGLVVALPVALCTLTAAYRQLFVRPGNRLAR
ncbi:MAG: hypothetical protein VKM97_05650 [Cyanobacteriota bacterium]|nr:hypothetical protein [Cyanobacteriota bacterium]